MSLYVGATASDFGLKTSGLIDHNTAYTWMAWVDLVSDTNDYGHIWAALGDNFDYYGNADWVGTKSDGVGVRLACYNGGSSGEIYGYDLVVGTPTHLAVVRESATSLKLYQDGSYINSVGVDVSTRTSTQREQLGALYGYPAPARMTAMKQWQAALTADEIVAEMKTFRPLRLANLHSWHPAIASDKATALKDFSGNGRDWTEQGTLSVQPESPSAGWGSRVVIILPVLGAAPQLLAPTGRLAGSTWTASTGGTTYSCVDETSPDDGDYAYTTTSGAWEEFTFDAPDSQHNASAEGGYVRYRLPAGSGAITVELRQSTTVLETWGPHTLTGSLQAFAQPITASTSNSSDLRLRFTAS
jgi:hypothetical protein